MYGVPEDPASLVKLVRCEIVLIVLILGLRTEVKSVLVHQLSTLLAILRFEIQLILYTIMFSETQRGLIHECSNIVDW